MLVNVFRDGEKRDKIAEFYDTYYPCSFLRGVLTETQEDERETQLTFTVRQENGLDLRKALLERPDTLNNTERGDL